MGTAGWKLQRRKEEELSALSQTTVLLPSYDCHGHPELSGEEAHFIRGRSLSHARDAQLFIFWSKSNRECKLSFIISSKHKRCRKNTLLETAISQLITKKLHIWIGRLKYIVKRTPLIYFYLQLRKYYFVMCVCHHFYARKLLNPKSRIPQRVRFQLNLILLPHNFSFFSLSTKILSFQV